MIRAPSLARARAKSSRYESGVDRSEILKVLQIGGFGGVLMFGAMREYFFGITQLSRGIIFHRLIDFE